MSLCFDFFPDLHAHNSFIVSFSGAEGVAFVESKAESLEYLLKKGRRTLQYLNAREEAFAGLVVRKNKAVRLLVRQKEAINFLAKAPQGLWNTQEKIKNTQVSDLAFGIFF